MDDRRILAAIVLLGAAAFIVKALEVGHSVATWWNSIEEAEPIVIDTQTNGGVSVSGTSATFGPGWPD